MKFVGACLVLCCFRIEAFAPSSRLAVTRTPSSPLSSNNNSFDISKPTFDLYTLRNVRGDALIRYNSLNQSEPLRINLYLLAMLSLFSYPALSDAVVGEPATLIGTVGSTAAGAFSAYRFVRECGRRSRKLNRMEKELNSQGLLVRLPASALADRPFDSTAFPLGQLRGKRRIVAICGSAAQLRTALVPFRALRKRFLQAAVLVVPVPTDGSSFTDWGVTLQELRSAPYLAEMVHAEEWVDYFSSLVENNNANENTQQLAWFGLSNSGKSFGSGAGSPPRLLEILGQSLLPVEVLDEEDASQTVASSQSDESAILGLQKEFYDILTGGDRERITNVFDEKYSPEVQEVLDGGGGIDEWSKCLEEGARPAGMIVSGCDVLVVSDQEACSTAIEFPKGSAFEQATLLAVQKWGRQSTSDKWKLQVHQTIPWSPDSRAGGTLRCDCRGCTALASRAAQEQYNFRGMID